MVGNTKGLWGARRQILTTIGVLLFGIVAKAYDFQNFQVNPEAYKLPNYQQPQKQVNGIRTFSSKVQGIDDLSLDSPLMREIKSYLERDFSFIRDAQKTAILKRNKNFNLGVKNYDGMVWQKPMGQFQIYLDRQVLPNPAADDWIVSDQLVIMIDAQTFLRQMQDEGVVDIDEANFGAFAGLQFHRVYEYRHFAPTFNDGLLKNIDKLILGFRHFSKPNIEELGENERLSKRDYLGFYAGGFVDVPLDYGLELSAGLLIKAEKHSEAVMRTPSRQDSLQSGEILRVQITKSESKSIGAELGIKLDFLNLLKLTLLRFEYSETFTESKATNLVFRQSDYRYLAGDTEVTRALAKAMRKNKIEEVIYGNVESKTEYSSHKKDSSFRFFNSGSHEQSRSTRSKVYIRGQENASSLQYAASETKFEKGWKGALWDMAFQSSIGIEALGDYKYTRTKKAKVDYARKDLNLAYDFALAQELFVYKNKKRYGEEAANFVKDFTFFDPKVLALIESRQIHGPMKFKVHIAPSEKAIDYLESFSNKAGKKLMQDFCGYEKQQRWSRFQRRSPEERCYRSLYSHFRKLKKSGDLDDKVWRTRKLLRDANKYAKRIEDIMQIVGIDGIYISGSLNAKTANGLDYKTYFEWGAKSNNRSSLETLSGQSLNGAPISPLLD